MELGPVSKTVWGVWSCLQMCLDIACMHSDDCVVLQSAARLGAVVMCRDVVGVQSSGTVVCNLTQGQVCWDLLVYTLHQIRWWCSLQAV